MEYIKIFFMLEGHDEKINKRLRLFRELIPTQQNIIQNGYAIK